MTGVLNVMVGENVITHNFTTSTKTDVKPGQIYTM